MTAPATVVGSSWPGWTSFSASNVVKGTKFYLIGYDRAPNTYQNLVGLTYSETQGSSYGYTFIFDVTASSISIQFTRDSWQEYMIYGFAYLTDK